MPKNKIETIPIEVSSRILRHISRGIYRSPAGALKELISNSYDAGAKKVTINTNYPVIDKIIVTDNGCGISKMKFQDVIQRIGFSEKNLGEEIKIINGKSNQKRKIIGHYGIGFLAIGQLAKKAIITSKARNTNTGIKVILDFEQFETHNTEGKILSVAKSEVTIEKEDKKVRRDKEPKFSIGQCFLQEVEFENNANEQSFTRVELNEIREDVQRQIASLGTSKLTPDVDSLRPYSSKFEDVIQLLRVKEQKTTEIKLNDKKVPSLREYNYEKLLWELSVYSPVPYPNNPIFQKQGKLHHFAILANQGDFEVVIDGFILHKPYEKWFWEEKKGFRNKIYSWIDEAYYKDFKVSGYLIYQPGTMVRPKVQQGILVRENLVAVGLYDTTFLNYPFNEGTKFNSLTGELFCSGLAGAMNVDRDSFNQTAEEYVALTEWFHNKLYNEIFPDIKLFQKESASPARAKNAEIVSDILELLLTKDKKVKKVVIKPLGRKEKRRVVIERSTLIINSDHRDCDMSTAKREKLLLAAALIIHGYISDDIFNEIADEIEKTKKLSKEL
jgi:hypothetical protein